MRLLIVEDNKDLQAIFADIFTTAGHEALVSNNGLEGITEAVDFQPDAVLLDIMMPEMDGYNFLHTLKNNTSMHPVVIVCSNLSQSVDIQRAYAAGADVYLKKSDYVGDELVKAVEEEYQKHHRATTASDLSSTAPIVDDEQF